MATIQQSISTTAKNILIIRTFLWEFSIVLDWESNMKFSNDIYMFDGTSLCEILNVIFMCVFDRTFQVKFS
jgi:hypothetical protein